MSAFFGLGALHQKAIRQPAGSAFDPMSLSWTGVYEADRITGPPADNAAVGTWADASGGARDLTYPSVTSERPTFKSAPTGFNGHPALLFDGVDDALKSVGAISVFATATAYEYFIVLRPNVIDTNAGTTYGNDSPVGDGGGYFGTYLKSTGPTAMAYNWDGTDDHADVTVATGQTTLLAVRHDAGNLVISKDGGTEVSVTSGNTQVLTNLLFVGRGTAVAQSFDGQIAALYINNAVLSAGNRASMISSLKTKYGIPP